MRTLVLLLALLSTATFGETPVPSEKAAKYHSLLLKRPKPGAIYERFASAWLEDVDIASLRTFLEARAADAKATTADRLVLGFFLSQQSEHDAAIATFAKALEADPNNADAWLQRAQAEARVSKYDEAIQSLDHIKGSQGEIAADTAKLKARLLTRTGKTEQALVVLKELAAAHPEDEDLQDEVADLHLDEGLQAEALEFLKALLERTKDPYQRVLRRLRMGDVLKHLDKRDDALAAYSQCLNDAAQDSWVEGEVLAQIEQTFRSKDDVTGLKDFLGKLAEKHAQRLALGQLRARVLIDLNEGDAAITLHRELVQKNPGNAALKESFIDMLARLQKFDEAVVQCRELLNQRPADKELRIHLATLMYQAKRPGEAMLELKPLLAGPKTPEFEMLRVARLYEGFEFSSDARKLYQATADAYPTSIVAQDALASYLHSHKNQAQAVAIWKKQAAAPAVKDEVLRVARALSSRGEHAPALEVLQARETEFGSDVVYLGQLVASATGSQRQDLAAGWAMKLVRMAKDGEALDDVLRQVRSVFRDEKLAAQTIKDLKSNQALSINERCLLAELLEQTGDPNNADKVLTEAPATDAAMAQREQAHLYMLRLDFEKAAAVVEKIATEKKEPQIVEMLVSLLIRNSSYDAALKWSGEWKRLLPGSARPWLSEARVLQLQQKPDEAVKVLKQAGRKFSDDISMTTALADAYAANNQLADTQRIYQQLYDDAQDVAGQIRWAGQLAETAQRRGAIKELLEAFQERQRNNRTSISPWLALAEIHRRTNNYEGRRSALLEASRLKPKDIDLLHQIAKMDEDQGEWRKAVETLNTAASMDKTTKTKQRLAEVHLRYGDEETGLRLAFELGGGSNMDPRDAESMVLGMMSRGNWKSAASVIEPLITNHPEDYRLRYLKMVCLVEADDSSAAINEAVALMDARKEVLTPSVSKNVTAMTSLLPDQIDPITTMVSNIIGFGNSALRYRSELTEASASNRYAFYSNANGRGPRFYFIPQNVSVVKAHVTAMIVQMKTEGNWPEAKVTEVVSRLNAAGHPVGESVQWFELSGGRNRMLSISQSEVEKNIGNKRLAQLWIGQLQGRGVAASAIPPALLAQLAAKGIQLPGITTGKSRPAAGEAPESKLLAKIYDHYRDKDPLTAVLAAMKLWQFDPKDQNALDNALALAPKVPVSDNASVFAFTAPFGYRRDNEALRTPEGKKLRDAALLVIKRYTEAHPDQTSWKLQEPVLHAAVGDWEAFVTSLETALVEQKKTRNVSLFAFGNSSIQLQPLNSYHVVAAITLLPTDIMQVLMPKNVGSGQMESLPADQATALNKAATRLSNPELRAFIAWRTGDKQTYEAFAEAQKTAAKPVLWPLLAKANELSTTDPAGAAAWLQIARTATTDRDKLSFINAAFVYAVMNLQQEKKTDAAAPFLKDAQLALLNLRRATATGSAYEMEQVLKAMETLDMKDEAARQRKLVATAKASQSNLFNNSLRNAKTDPYQLKQDIRNGKSATAIPLAVRALQNLIATASNGSGYSTPSYELSQWSSLAREQPAAAAEIWKQLSVNAPTTLKSKLERALLAETLGRAEVAMPLYEEVLKTKPRDAVVRYRLATLLAKRSDDPKAAVEHLLAIPPADLNSVSGGISNQFDSQGDPRERIRYARAIARYLEQAKGKGQPYDFTWCERVVDLLITGSFSSSASYPSLLDENAKVASNMMALHEERMKVFDEFCKIALDYPILAPHVIPAQFALAHAAKQDESIHFKHAREALTALASLQSSGYRYGSSNSWEESYNGSYGARRLWTPQVSEMLLYQARQLGQEKQFKDEIVPLIRVAYGPDIGTEFELRAKVWFCPESDFLTTVKEMQTRFQRSANGSGEAYDPQNIIRIWKQRDFTVPLTDIITTYVVGQTRRNYGVSDDLLVPYVQGLTAKGKHDEVLAFTKHLMAAVIDKPESEWRDLIAKNPPRPGIKNLPQPAQGSAADRIRKAIDLAWIIARSDVFCWIDTLQMLQRAGFEDFDRFAQMSTSLITRQLPDKAVDLIPVLERSSWLKSLPDFDPIQTRWSQYGSSFEAMVLALNTKGKTYTAPLVEALQRRQEKSATLGTALLIGRLVELTPDMAIALAPQAQAFAALPAERQSAVLKLARSVWPDFDREVRKNPDLAPFARSSQKTKLNAANKLLAAKTTQDFDNDDADFERKWHTAVADAINVDPKLAQQALEHGVKLVRDRYAKNEWSGPQWYNGYNIATGALEKICRLASDNETRGTVLPSLASIGFALRVCEQPEQRDFIFTFGEGDWHWGALMAAYWERSGGYRDPRKASHELLAELKRVLGETSPQMLPEVFMDFAKLLPRWYRPVLDDEATKLAAAPGELQALAKEMNVGIGLLEATAPVMEHLKTGMTKAGQHPFTRAVLAALMIERTDKFLSEADANGCLENVIWLLENDAPTSGVFLGPLLNTINRTEAHPLAEKLRLAWLHRARNNKQGLKSGQVFEPSGAEAVKVLEAFARNPDEKQLRVLYDASPKAFQFSVETSFVLARHQRTELLKEIIKASDGTVKGNTDHARRVEKFRDADKDVVQTIEAAFKDNARLGQRARIYAITAMDAGVNSKALKRDQRLKVEAERFVGEKGNADDPMLKHLIDSVPAAEVLAKALLPTLQMDAVVNRAASANDAAATILEVPITLAMTALGAGDDKPWKALLESTKRETKNDFWNPFTFRVATVAVAQVRFHGLAKSQPMILALRDVLALAPSERNSYPSVAHAHLMLCMLSGQMQDFQAWKKALPEERVKSAKPRSSTWFAYMLDATPVKDKEDGGKLVLDLLNEPWSREVAQDEVNFNYRDRWPKRLDDESLRKHTTEILNADPGNLAALDAVMNAWTSEKSAKPLLEAVKSVQAKCEKTKHAKALDRMAAIVQELQ